LLAPLDKNTPVGSVTATIDGKTVAEAKLYSATSIPEGSFLQTTWDEILLYFE
jgi:D-alanyl-D-alanine carboxypeptidase